MVAKMVEQKTGTDTAGDLRERILQALLEVAPEAETVELDPAVAFRDQIELDSIDFLNFVLKLEEKAGVAILESDYPKLASLDGCLAYLGSS